MLKSTRSLSIRTQAQALRQQGHTYMEICAELGCSIPKGTLAYWFREIRLTPQQQDRIRAKIVANGARGRPLAREAWAKKVARWREGIEARVQPFGRLPYTDSMLGSWSAASCTCVREENTHRPDI